MSKLENRCANCRGKLGLVHHDYRGLRFCRKACKEDFLARIAKEHARMRKWLRWQPKTDLPVTLSRNVTNGPLTTTVLEFAMVGR